MDELKLVFTDSDKSIVKCKMLAKDHCNAINLEAVSVSEHSPYVVGNDENIARQIFSPIHYDHLSNEVKAAAFDDVNNKGLSVNRLSLIDEDATIKQGIEKQDTDNSKYASSGKPIRSYIGYTKAKVEIIRNDEEDGMRIFAVYDSALPEASYHADVCLIFQEASQKLPKKAANLERRKRLQEMFGQLKLIS